MTSPTRPQNALTGFNPPRVTMIVPRRSPMRANLIAGQWTAGTQSNPDINPSDVSDVIDQYAAGDAAAVDVAVAAARAAFPAWSVSTPPQRFDALDFGGTQVPARRAELGEPPPRAAGEDDA